MLLPLFMTMLVIGMCMKSEAQVKVYKVYHVPQKKQAFYYFPKVNVYYDLSAKLYYYPYKNRWAVSKVIPAGYGVRTSPRFTVYHFGADVWVDNREHRMTYKKYVAYPVVVYQQPVRLIYR